MSTRGIGAKLLSAFGSFPLGRQSHLPRKDLAAGDTDAAEVSMWEDWFFESPDAPAAGQPMMLRNAGVQHSAYRGWRHAG